MRAKWMLDVLRHDPRVTIDPLVDAVAEMSRKRIGALIVLMGGDPLEDLIETGVLLYGRLSVDLLLTIFSLKSPLHDGAAIVRGGEVVAAGCCLPVVDLRLLMWDPFWRRELAATRDLRMITVSEETGAVRYVSGRLMARVSPDGLRDLLLERDRCGESDPPDST
jgi:diadenylate cyclase